MENQELNVGTSRGETSHLSPREIVPRFSIPTGSSIPREYSTGYEGGGVGNSGVYWSYIEVIPLSTRLIIRGV